MLLFVYSLWIDSNYCASGDKNFKTNCLKGRVHLRLRDCELGFLSKVWLPSEIMDQAITW